ncbi:hypothetical protein BO83DRAFT_392632 [Aspergillus eucalypticola CBS 122712]|uniref:Zn(2)-C6 fungal-type domain-containing protein n=1 Tax=Aspergillus eucalypticola (strain CBS 122712 / IBT 29274) TaxID=1448314 RepID=A0A317URQ1_ASPEC|nr:uncharacterized protein BO83DRAFT_392632 [Aspergillus eucalypticola CBS 122712]PWY64315.1 hypothetical protein BO83DRAFT_392632 [Aspergillus eucalypticola CBS 122712]
MTLSPTACRRCRQQKRKCTRELPSCRRCQEFAANCDYPSPPDRRLLAVQRWARRANRNQGTQIPVSTPAWPFDTGLALLQSYFSQFVTSGFFFNQEDFFSNYLAGNIPKSLLRSLCAFSSSIFTPRANARSNLESHSRSWLVTPDLEVNHGRDDFGTGQLKAVEALLTSFHLSLYWYAQDSAFQHSIQWILQRQAEGDALSPQTALSVFGVYWSIRCIIQEPGTVDSRVVVELPDLPAFATVREISHSIQAGRRPHSENVDEDLRVVSRLLAFMGRWFRVREFITALRMADDPVSMLSELTRLDMQTTACYQSFKADWDFWRMSSPKSARKYFISEILYHQCRAVSHLHMYLESQQRDGADHEFIQLTGSIAFRQMLLLTEAVNRLLVMTPREQACSIPPVVGYSTFLAASLQLAALVHLRDHEVQRPLSNGDGLENALRACVLANLSVLSHMKCSWAPLQTLWDKLLPLVYQASLIVPEVEFFACQPHPIPLLHETTAMELQNYVTGHLSPIMTIVDIAEPFYLPDSRYDSSARSTDLCPPRELPPAAPYESPSAPCTGGTSATNELYEVIPEMHDHLNHLGLNFF